jgi:hypothetical protein
MWMLPTGSVCTVASVRKNRLPFEASPPMTACALSGRLFVAAVDLKQQAAVLVALGPEAESTNPVPLPLEYPIGLAACGGDLYLTGAEADQTQVLLTIDEPGLLKARDEVPVSGSIAYGPRPFCLIGRPIVLWETSDDNSGRLHAYVQAGSSTWDVTSQPLRGLTTWSEAATSTEELVLARIQGSAGELGVRWLSSGLVELHSLTLARGASATALAAGGGILAVAWVAPRQGLCVQWFDSSRHPLGLPSVLVPVAPGSTLRSLRVFASEQGHVAVIYQSLRVDDNQFRRVDEFICLLAAGQTAVATLDRVEPPGAGGGTGGWLGSRFVLVHGSGEPAVSVYESNWR